jgi:glycosyltransferase involved in cell wall biosynthesis
VEQRLRLILLGDGSERWRVHDFINQNSLSGAVLTPGRISPSELPKWFRAANGYVSCAASDGTSVSLLEALATGLPVVITDVPSNREWVKEDENGWLATSAESFTRAMLRVSTLTPAKRRAISITNRRIVAERANWDQNFPRLLDLYHRVMHAHKAVPA